MMANGPATAHTQFSMTRTILFLFFSQQTTSMRSLLEGTAAFIVLLSLNCVSSSNKARSLPKRKYEEQEFHEGQARQLCAQLTLDEKIALLHGIDGPYVGNVPSNGRLGIPAINMNDGPQGFRGIPGTSTAWPCALSLAASWDVHLTFKWGQAMAREFLDKGSNMFLGPGVNVIRVPQNGRNFEYLSGEDPVLGSKLVASEIRGLQQLGVIANVKHFVHNNQETDRSTVDQVVDERTHWEIYMPPFQAAVEAGVLSFMCSYNKVNGEYACENPSILAGDLKSRLNFSGFVVSDWGATHSTINAAKAGLDVEMPAGNYFGKTLKKAVLAHKISMAEIDDKVNRILFALSASGSMNRTEHGSIEANVTSDAHNRLARDLGAAGVVLLKNEDTILPLCQDQKIHVIGDIIATGRGSGRVIPPYLVTGFAGIQNRLHAANATGSVTHSTMNNVDNDKVEDADVVVIFTSTTSSEGSDRASLSFPPHEIHVIEKVISVAFEKIVVVGIAPGAVLLPFADRVPGLLLAFMPGQEGGNSIADVLFGDVNPSARLPLTIPNVENEMGFTKQEYPGINRTAIYTEKLLTGYRWYNAKQIKPKFAFGFGLSYTEFQYSNLEQLFLPRKRRSFQKQALYSFSFTLANIGRYDGHETWQVYLASPKRDAVGEPPKQLKNFGKEFLAEGSSKTVTFVITEQDISFWSVDTHGWQVTSGEFTVLVGPSSDYLPLSWTFHHDDLHNSLNSIS